jgi:hypothetical protein
MHKKKVKMQIIRHLLERAVFSLCLLAALVLTACGPGTGGTGTGPPVANTPTAFANSVFTSPGTGSSTAVPAPNPSATPTATATCAAVCAGSLQSQALSLILQAESIVLSSPCATFTFTGLWGASATGESVVQGTLESTTVVNGQTSRTTQSASLTLQFAGTADSSNIVTLSIRDGAGNLLLPSVTLQRASSAAPASTLAGC